MEKSKHMNAIHVWAVGLTSAALSLGCKSSPEDDVAAGRRNQDTPTPSITVGARPAATAAAPHHEERPGAAASIPTPTSVTTGTIQTGADTDDEDNEAEAKFQSVPNMKIEGDAELDEVADGVKIVIEVEHALPGEKGIHVHQTDNCSDIANKSMGEHFAPTMHKHGLPNAAEHHLGDLGNITIDKDGKGKLEITAVGANLKPGDPLSFIGKSIVIHESNDKGTGASGDAGKPIACAPIRAD